MAVEEGLQSWVIAARRTLNLKGTFKYTYISPNNRVLIITKQRFIKNSNNMKPNYVKIWKCLLAFCLAFVLTPSVFAVDYMIASGITGGYSTANGAYIPFTTIDDGNPKQTYNVWRLIDGLTERAVLAITDLNGRVFMNEEIENNQSVSTSSLPSGTYLVNVMIKGMSKTNVITKK